MSDDLNIPRRHIVTLDEAAATPVEKSKPRGISSTADFVQKRELVVILTNLTNRINAGVTNASEAVGEAVFDSIAEKTEAMLHQMEHTLRQEFRAEFERRSWRGRWRRFTGWLMGYQRTAPALVTADVVLDPAMQREAALAELRDLIAGAGPSMAIELPTGTTVEDAQAIEAELRAERQAAVDAVTPEDEAEEILE